MRAIFLSVLLVFLAGCGGRKDVNSRGEIKLRGEKPVSLNGKHVGDLLQKGTASWYGRPFHGRKTSNGEIYDMNGLTAAHKTLPFGTWVEVENRDNGRRITIRINDRGPFVRGRILDLSRGAAQELGILDQGIADVALYLGESRGRTPSRGNQEPPPKPIIDNGFWTVQVGSFSEEGRARDYARHMEQYGAEVRVELSGNMYRVRLGKFRKKTAADEVAAKVLEEEGVSAWITYVAP